METRIGSFKLPAADMIGRKPESFAGPISAASNVNELFVSGARKGKNDLRNHKKHLVLLRLASWIVFSLKPDIRSGHHFFLCSLLEGSSGRYNPRT